MWRCRAVASPGCALRTQWNPGWWAGPSGKGGRFSQHSLDLWSRGPERGRGGCSPPRLLPVQLVNPQFRPRHGSWLIRDCLGVGGGGGKGGGCSVWSAGLRTKPTRGARSPVGIAAGMAALGVSAAAG